MRNVKTLAVLALLLAIFGAGDFLGARAAWSRMSSKSVVVLSEMATLRLALDMFRIDAGRLPTAAEGLAILRKPRFRGPYVGRSISLRDPWGRPYVYGFDYTIDPNGIPTITSLGKDGLVGGVGDDTDFTLWLRLSFPVSASSAATQPTTRPSP